ncbi:MAG: L,D-transpeptidase [Prochlorococcus sp.]|nr:L,D-transpeptidase [Prochlorococcaceae cyanobacterium Fu_MAG_50]
MADRRWMLNCMPLLFLSLSCLAVRPALADTTVIVSLRHRYLTLMENGRQIAKYPVAIGAPESPTPPGDYRIRKKVDDPSYYSHSHHKLFAPGKSNPVGVRYMVFLDSGSKEYAIHGTAWPNWVKLRAAVSLGCIRMLNHDVVKLYQDVEVGTPVIVTDK